MRVRKCAVNDYRIRSEAFSRIWEITRTGSYYNREESLLGGFTPIDILRQAVRFEFISREAISNNMDGSCYRWIDMR